MSKKLLLSACCLLSIVYTHSQNNPDSAGFSTDSISTKTWMKKLNQTFGIATTGQGDAINLANYGSIEPVNGVFKLNVFGPIGNPEKNKIPFFNVTASGKLSGDNVGVLFNNSKFSSGVKIGGKIHIPLPAVLDVSGNELDSISRKIKHLTDQRDLKKLIARADNDETALNIRQRYDAAKLKELSANLKEKRDSIVTIQNTLSSNPGLSDARIKEMGALADGLTEQIKKLTEESLKTADRIEHTKAILDDRDNYLNAIDHQLDEKYKKDRDSIELSATVKQFQFSWISIVGNVERNKYYKFDQTQLFDNQFGDTSLTSYSFGLEYNFAGYLGKKNNAIAGKLPHMHIFNLGFVRLQNNNTVDLETTEMSDSKKFELNDSTHSLSTKYNVYTEPIEEYEAWKAYVNYYYFFGRKKDLILHLFPDVEFRNTQKNPFSAGIGFIFGVHNQKDKVLFNIELYTKLIDAGKALPQTEDKLLKRAQVGLNIGVPINLPNQTK